MASLSQFYYSDYISSINPPTPMTTSDGSSTASAMHAMLPCDSALFFPEVSATFPNTICGNGGFTAPNCRQQYDQPYHDFGDQECSVLASKFFPFYPMTADNWEIQGGIPQRVEEPTLKIPRYSAEERKDRIVRYLKKRSQRNFNKTIKYACRKTLADKRIRVRGRFAKNINELCEEDHQTLGMKTDHNLQESEQSFYDDPLQMKPYDEEWLQEAIASLMYYRMLPDNIMEINPDKYLY